MAIQHKDIPESELHEPKGVSLADAQTVYVANGLGTGSWGKVGSETIAGLGGQNNTSGLMMVSDGQGGFRYVPSAAYGSVIINNNSAGFAVTAATDNTLNTVSDYKVMTGTGAGWVPDVSYNTATASDGITILHHGIYRIDVGLDIVAFPSATARIALKYFINDNQYSVVKFSAKSHSEGDTKTLTGFGLYELNEGDIVRAVVASTHAGNVVFESGNITLTLVRAL